MSAADEAFVTLATNDGYCMGAVVVARSLRRHGTSRHIVAMITPGVSAESRHALQQVVDEVVPVDVLDSGDRAHLSWLGRPELGVTFTKLHAWTLTRYRKCVFLDADTVVLRNVDELFEREELSASPDPGWPDCFNTGVFVFRPSLDTHARLLEHARRHGSFDGGDQGLLNSFFSDWSVRDINRHLPFVYNMSASTVYTYLPAFQKYGQDARIVHFLGPAKPWHSGPRARGQRRDAGMERFIALWWKEYVQHTDPCTPHRKTHSTQLAQTTEEHLGHFSPADHRTDRPPPEKVTEQVTEGATEKWEEPGEDPQVDSGKREGEESESQEPTNQDPGLASEGPAAGGPTVEIGDKPWEEPGEDPQVDSGKREDQESERHEPTNQDPGLASEGPAAGGPTVEIGDKPWEEPGEDPQVDSGKREGQESGSQEPTNQDPGLASEGPAAGGPTVEMGDKPWEEPGEDPQVDSGKREGQESESQQPTNQDPGLASEGPAAGGPTVEIGDKPSPQDAAGVTAQQPDRRQMWEEGRADYLGTDAFRHIQRKLDSFLR